MLPSHSCGGTLQNLYLKLLHSSTQTSADGLNLQRQVSRITDEEGETWSPFGMSKLRSRPESLVADCSIPRCSHRKGAVAKGSPTTATSRRHLQCRGVSSDSMHGVGQQRKPCHQSQNHCRNLSLTPETRCDVRRLLTWWFVPTPSLINSPQS